MLYDVFGFTSIFFLFFVFWRANAAHSLHPSVFVVHFIASAVMIFTARFLLRVYHTILRYGSIKNYLRLFFADLAGGAVYVLINLILPERYQVPVWLSLALVGCSFLLSLLSRIAYFGLFRAAQKDNGTGRFCRNFLRTFAMVDALDGEENSVLTFDEWIGRSSAEKASPINEIQRVARQFQITGEVTAIEQINKGYINRTYHVQTLSLHNHVHHYTLQRINTNVFPDPDALMANYELVTNHLRDNFLLPGHTEKGSVTSMKPTKDGKPYFRDDSGCWRMMTHITEVYGMDIPDSPKTFYYAGMSFGLFVKCMSDVPIDQIHVVIPNFHNTYSRYLDLEAVIEKDPVHRLRDVWEEVSFVRARKDCFGLISDALESGRIPTRICHNDCNLNNILFSEKTHLPVAVIDLDTVMPGSPLYDYGDSMRIGTNTAKDDEKDLTKVSCNLELYEQYARGYLESCGDMLTKEELELLPYASMIITAEDGIRFLMDHINGDVYYNVFYPHQNLDRARTQLKLLEDMERKEMKIRDILKKIYVDLGLDGDPYKVTIKR